MKNIIHYRNGMYQGSIQVVSNKHDSGFSEQRQGFGILALDDGQMYLGKKNSSANWKQNLLHGQYYRIINEQQYIIGEMNQGIPHNFFMYYSRNYISIAFYQKGKIIGKSLHADIIKGRCKIIDRDANKVILDRQVPQILDYSICQLGKILNYPLPGTVDSQLYLKMLMNQPPFSSIKFTKHLVYYGYTQNKKARGLGVIINIAQCNYRVVSMGEYFDKQLSGMARLYINGQITWDGKVEKDMLQGKGIKYNQFTNSYTFGQYQNNQLKKMLGEGKGFPSKIVQTIRKQYHLMSLNFKNQYINIESFELPEDSVGFNTFRIINAEDGNNQRQLILNRSKKRLYQKYVVTDLQEPNQTVEYIPKEKSFQSRKNFFSTPKNFNQPLVQQIPSVQKLRMNQQTVQMVNQVDRIKNINKKIQDMSFQLSPIKNQAHQLLIKQRLKYFNQNQYCNQESQVCAKIQTKTNQNSSQTVPKNKGKKITLDQIYHQLKLDARAQKKKHRNKETKKQIKYSK